MELENEINKKIIEYEKMQENKELLDYIRKIVSEKENKWDKGINNNSNSELLTMLLFEYSTGIEKITGGKVSSKYVIDKLNSSLEILRFGDFKKGFDDIVTYGTLNDNGIRKPIKVTDEQYAINCRKRQRFGAHAPTFTDEFGNIKTALVLFEKGQKLADGTALSGIDLNNLTDIRHTFFHELTHVMEKSIVQMKDLFPHDVVFKDGEKDSIFINYAESPEHEDLVYYLDSVEEKLQSNEVLFSGISTIEINHRKSRSRIMRNQISEGATEFISNLVMDTTGVEINESDRDRYGVQKEIVRRVFEHRGLEESITDYLTDSHKLISYMESCKVDGKDFLHYADEFVHANYEIGRDISDHVDRKANFDAIQKMFKKLWQDELDENETNILRFQLVKILSDNYNGISGDKKYFEKRIREKIDLATSFGKALNQNFPKKKKEDVTLLNEDREV